MISDNDTKSANQDTGYKDEHESSLWNRNAVDEGGVNGIRNNTNVGNGNKCYYYEEKQAWPLTGNTTCYTGAVQTHTSTPVASVAESSSSASTTLNYVSGPSGGPLPEFCVATQFHTCRLVAQQQQQGHAAPVEPTTTSSGGETATATKPMTATRGAHEDPYQMQSRRIPAVSVVSKTKETPNHNAGDDKTNTARKSKSEMQCVGYSVTPEWEATALIAVSLLKEDAASTMEATVAAANQDSASHTKPTVSTQPQQQQQTSRPPNRHSRSPSMTSVVSEASGGDTGSTMGGGTTEAAFATGSPPPPPPTSVSVPSSPETTTNDETLEDATTAASIRMLTATTTTKSSAPPMARIIVQPLQLQQQQQTNTQNDNDMENNASTNRGIKISFLANVDFRPLALTAHQFSFDSTTTATTERIDDDDKARSPHHHRPGDMNDTCNHHAAVGVWMGSADDNLLHFCWCCTNGEDAGDDDHNDYQLWTAPETLERPLIPVVLDDPAFLFITPVMAIDCIPLVRLNSPLLSDHCLAVACQDGTVRLIQFSIEKSSNNGQWEFRSVRQNQVIVDGPIVCAHLTRVRQINGNNDDCSNVSTVHLTVGSLCGYTADLVLNLETMELKGPFLGIQGFWNDPLNAEDSVLAVHWCVENSTVWVGTHSGRCLVYQKRKRTERRLENSGYSATNIVGNINEKEEDTQKKVEPGSHNESHYYYVLQWECQLPYPVHGVLPFRRDDGLEFVLVTTRRSLHLFQKLEPVHEEAALVKARLLKLLKQ